MGSSFSSTCDVTLSVADGERDKVGEEREMGRFRTVSSPLMKRLHSVSIRSVFSGSSIREDDGDEEEVDGFASRRVIGLFSEGDAEIQITAVN